MTRVVLVAWTWLGSMSAQAQTPLIPLGSTWKYLDDGTDPGGAWTTTAFDDIAWSSGHAELGYGDGDEQTVVNGGPSGNRFITMYFRCSFSVADPGAIGMLRLDLLRDDGAVVYLNGSEVLRDNMPCGPVAAWTLALAGISGTGEMAFLQEVLESSTLVAGTNVLAVEIHQSSPASSDISFNLELTAGGAGPTPFPTPEPGVTRFAVIGDYGLAGIEELHVSMLVKGWSPEFILTVGDNNYFDGSAATIDANIGRYYHDFIAPYSGCFGAGSPTGNRFFPSLGNHDWETPGALPYLNYFTLPESQPGNERYYRFRAGPVDFFALDSDPREPHGISSTSVQAQWLQAQLACSYAPWRLVYMHHAPYSSSAGHGSHPALQWPFAAWGATAVLAGHDHDYERISADGIVYFVNGLGGNPSLYPFTIPVTGSAVRYNGDVGAMLVEASATEMHSRFFNRSGVEIDSYVSSGTQPTCVISPTPTHTPAATSTFTSSPTATNTATPMPSGAATPSSTHVSSPTASPQSSPSATPTPFATELSGSRGPAVWIFAGLLVSVLTLATHRRPRDGRRLRSS